MERFSRYDLLALGYYPSNGLSFKHAVFDELLPLITHRCGATSLHWVRLRLDRAFYGSELRLFDVPAAPSGADTVLDLLLQADPGSSADLFEVAVSLQRVMAPGVVLRLLLVHHAGIAPAVAALLLDRLANRDAWRLLGLAVSLLSQVDDTLLARTVLAATGASVLLRYGPATQHNWLGDIRRRAEADPLTEAQLEVFTMLVNDGITDVEELFAVSRAL